MISGCLFLNSDREVGMKHICCRNIAHLASAFFFLSAIYTGLDLLFVLSQGEVFSIQMAKDVIKAFIAGPTHMWFLYALVGLYLLVPFLKKIAEDKKLTEYFLLLWVIFGMFGRFTNALSELQVLRDFLTSFTVRFVSGYTGCFLLGHYLRVYYHPAKRQRIVNIFLGILAYIFTVSITLYMSKKLGTFYEGYLSVEQINCVIMAASVYLAAETYFSKENKFKKNSLFFTAVANQSFGIYLMHMLIFNVFTQIWGKESDFFTPWNVIGVIAAVYVTGWGISYLLKKIPHIGRWIV